MAASLPMASSASAAARALSPVADIRAAMIPATVGVENDVPLHEARPSKFRTSPTCGGSLQTNVPVGYALTRSTPAA